MKKIIPLLALLLLIAPLGGCFGMGPQSTGPVATVTPSPYVNPELLIPKGDAERILGSALKNPVQLPETFPPATAAAETEPAASGVPEAPRRINPAPSKLLICFYEAAEPGGRFLQVSMLQTNDEMAAQKVSARLQFDALKGTGPSNVADPKLYLVEGVGDEAFIAAPGLHIMFNGYYILVSLGDPYDPTVHPNGKTNEQMLLEAGKLAVKNLAEILGVTAPAEGPQSSPEAAAQ
jgi:hypothetical protein